MAGEAKQVIVHIPQIASYIGIALLVSLMVVVISYQLWVRAQTTPRPFMEGFAGPVNGVSELSCGQSSIEATKLYSILSQKKSSTETGPDDLLELKVLLSKLCCFKKDLLSVGSLVNATKNEHFVTSQDMEPVAETVARCFAKTIPVRDLELYVDKWNKRGDFLIRRLCTSYDLTEAEQKHAIDLFKALMTDILDISKTVCLKGAVSIAGVEGPRMVHGTEPSSNSHHGEYKGYY
jgi:hypothetical protein